MIGLGRLLAISLPALDGPPSVSPPNIVVQDGHFVLRETGEHFRPAGFNYIRLFHAAGTADHDSFSKSGFDAAEQEAMWQRLASQGFNTLDGRVYDTHEQPRLWNAADHESAIFKILADELR